MTEEKTVSKLPTAPVLTKPIAPMVFVRGGGTATSKSESLYERRYQQAEVRRNRAESDKRIASVPIERGGGKLVTNQMTRHPEIPKAFIHLKYVTSSGDETGVEGLGDIIIGQNPAKPMEIMLILVCPRCAQGQKRLQDCQMQIRQSQKQMTLTPGKGDRTFVYEDETYKSAGYIKTERCKCPDCSWAFRIDNNRVWPD